MKLYQLRDEKSGNFRPPFAHAVDIDALRAVHSVAQQKDVNNPLANYPADFRLYKTGEFDAASGRIKQDETFYDMGTIASISESFRN